MALLGVTMATSKPKVFIGSSRECLPVAQVLQSQLKNEAAVQLWNQGIFGISDYTLDSLMTASKEFDFAAFIFGADDMLKSRGERYLIARDNVVLELGLFAGRLGRERTFLVVQQTSERLHLPSDLHGITPAKFEWPENKKFEYNKLPAELEPAALEIRAAIEKRGTIDSAIKPLSGGMIFVALCLRDRSYTVDGLAEPFRRFQTVSERIPEGKAGAIYSFKAVKYACQCLEAVGMAESFGGNEYEITNLGKSLLQSDKLQSRHKPSYQSFKEVMKKNKK
jgi:hypothetical protein